MTNIKELRTFLAWLRNTEVDLATQEESDLDELVREYVGETDQAEEPCPVCRTVCEHCGADVEVWLNHPKLESRDRGGNKHCGGLGGKLHRPVLDADDLSVREALLD